MNLGGDKTTQSMAEIERIAFNALETALTSNITRFDHADIYKNGESEKQFGNFLKSQNINRQDVWIQGKAGIILRSSNFNSNHYDSSSAYLKEKILRSIENLRCDYLDSFLIHRFDPFTHPEEIGLLIEEMISKKLVLSFGVSNFNRSQMEYFQKFIRAKLSTNQVQLSLVHNSAIKSMVFQTDPDEGTQEYSTGLLEYCAAHNIEIQAYSPLAKGKISDPTINQELHNTLTEIGNQLETRLENVALAFLIDNPFNIVPIIGTTKSERISQLADSRNLKLNRLQWYKLLHASLGTKLP